MGGLDDMDLSYAPFTYSNKDIIVISDGSDNDGFGAAFAAWKAFGDEGEYTFYKHEGSADEIGDLIKDKKVVFSDLALSKMFIDGCALFADELVVIDHHATSEEDYNNVDRDNVEIVYNDDKSAARLAWEYFHDEDSVPELIRYVEDYDLWRFDLKHSEAINLALDVQPLTFEAWDGLAQKTPEVFRESMRMKGEPMIQFRNSLIDGFIDNHEITSIIEGYKVACLNVGSYDLYSPLGSRFLDKKPDIDAVLMWQHDPNGSSDEHISVKASMRARNEDAGQIHVGEICQSFGGGGHQGAGGFTTSWEKLKDILNIS